MPCPLVKPTWSSFLGWQRLEPLELRKHSYLVFFLGRELGDNIIKVVTIVATSVAVFAGYDEFVVFVSGFVLEVLN